MDSFSLYKPEKIRKEPERIEKNMSRNDESVTRRTPPSKDITATIVGAVSEATDTNPRNLPPLGEIIDPDSVNRLFSKNAVGERRTEGYATFEFAGCVILVDHDDRVIVLPQPETGSDVPG